MKYKGKDLEFISRIMSDGSGIIDSKKIDLRHLDDETFELLTLSLTRETYIAVGFNIYIVKIKQ